MHAMNKKTEKFFDKPPKHSQQTTQHSMENLLTQYLTHNQDYLWKRVKHSLTGKVIEKASRHPIKNTCRQQWIEDTVYDILKQQTIGEPSTRNFTPVAHDPQPSPALLKDLQSAQHKYKKYKNAWQQAKNNLQQLQRTSNLFVSQFWGNGMKNLIQKSNNQFWRKLTQQFSNDLLAKNKEKEQLRDVIVYLVRQRQFLEERFHEVIGKYVEIKAKLKQSEEGQLSKVQKKGSGEGNEQIIRALLQDNKSKALQLKDLNNQITKISTALTEKDNQLTLAWAQYAKHKMQSMHLRSLNELLEAEKTNKQKQLIEEKQRVRNLQEQKQQLEKKLAITESERDSFKGQAIQLQEKARILEQILAQERQMKKYVSEIQTQSQGLQTTQPLTQTTQTITQQTMEDLSRAQAQKSKILFQSQRKSQQIKQFTSELEQIAGQLQSAESEKKEKDERIQELEQIVTNYSYFIQNDYRSAFQIYTYLLEEKGQTMSALEAHEKNYEELKRQNELLQKINSKEREIKKDVQRQLLEERQKIRSLMKKIDQNALERERQQNRDDDQLQRKLDEVQLLNKNILQENQDLKKINLELEQTIQYANSLFSTKNLQEKSSPVLPQKKFYRTRNTSIQTSSIDNSRSSSSLYNYSHDRDLTPSQSEDNLRRDHVQIQKYEDQERFEETLTNETQLLRQANSQQFYVSNSAVLRLLTQFLNRQNKQDALTTLLDVLKPPLQAEEKIKEYLKHTARVQQITAEITKQPQKEDKSEQKQKLQDRLFKFLTDG